MDIGGRLLAPPGNTTRLEWSLDFGSSDPKLQATQVADRVALDRILDAIAEQASEPLIVELVSPNGARLGVGLGPRGGVLSFNDSSDPPYFVSAGNLGSSTDEVVFYHQGHWTEFPGSALVTIDDARDAARAFIATGKRPENVPWEEI